MPVKRARLWVCPKCGARFITRNMWHSCGRATEADWKRRMTPQVRTLYRRFRSMIGACGPFHVGPAKTRIAFLGQVRFAGVTNLTPTGLTISFALPTPLRSKRFRSIQEVVPGWWVHRLVVTDAAELDGQLQQWLQRSYDLMGMRGRLAGKDRTRTSRKVGRPG